MLELCRVLRITLFHEGPQAIHGTKVVVASLGTNESPAVLLYKVNRPELKIVLEVRSTRCIVIPYILLSCEFQIWRPSDMDIARAPERRKISQLRSALLVAVAVLMGFIGLTFIDQFIKAFARSLRINYIVLMGPLAHRIYIYECIWFGLSVVFIPLLHWAFSDWVRKIKPPTRVL